MKKITRKADALKTGKKLAKEQGHTMKDYYENGKDLLLAECSDCGSRAILFKNYNKRWRVFGLATSHPCEKIRA